MVSDCIPDIPCRGGGSLEVCHCKRHVVGLAKISNNRVTCKSVCIGRAQYTI